MKGNFIMNKLSQEKFASQKLNEIMKNIQSIYLHCPSLSNSQEKMINKAMDNIDIAQHKIIGKPMNTFYKDQLDSDIRLIATNIYHNNLSSAKRRFNKAKSLIKNHVDNDSDLYEQLDNVLFDVKFDINSANGTNIDDEISSDGVRSDVKKLDNVMDYNCGVLE